MTKSVDKAEVDRFGDIAGEWWDPEGKFQPLHRINPVRLAYIRERLSMHTSRPQNTIKMFAGLTILDVGCGGGLMSEPLARLGAQVTGVDPSERNIAVARDHAEKQDLDIGYLTGTTHDLASASDGGRVFDCVIALEVVEHVPDVRHFLQSCADLLKPGGLLVVSTLNRTPQSYALGIVAAEYVLGWLPRGTHQWDRFVTTEEMREHFAAIGLAPVNEKGLSFDPLRYEWRLGEDCRVNYFSTATKPAA
jgi:2-polyprenyl-6-hydroxyphenyl methylase/3-demethylubiquinone-9 3-methyltransferase